MSGGGEGEGEGGVSKCCSSCVRLLVPYHWFVFDGVLFLQVN